MKRISNTRREMTIKIIDKQDDGYTVEIDDRDQVHISCGDKKVSCHISHFRPWDNLNLETKTRWSDRIPDKSGLFASPTETQLYRVRSIGDSVQRIREHARAAQMRYDEEKRVQDAQFAEQAAAQKKADAPLIDSMLHEEQRLVALIPSGCLRCDATMHSDGDGGSYATFSCGGTNVHGPAAHVVGWASASRPGAQSAFESRCVAYVLSVDLAAIRRSEAAKIAEINAKKEAIEKHHAEAFARAKSSGEKQQIESWMTDRCMNHNSDECSFDRATRWAMPDGSHRTTYTCCY